MAYTATLPVRATGSFTLADALDDQDSVRIGDQVYVFALTTDAANEVKIGASATATAANLVLAVNGTGVGDGSDYHAGTAQPTGITAVSAAGLVTFTASIPGTIGNSLALDGAVAGTDITTVGFQGGAGDLQTFISNIISLNQINGEVIRELSLVLDGFVTAASLP